MSHGRAIVARDLLVPNVSHGACADMISVAILLFAF